LGKKRKNKAARSDETFGGREGTESARKNLLLEGLQILGSPKRKGGRAGKETETKRYERGGYCAILVAKSENVSGTKGIAGKGGKCEGEVGKN